MVEMECLNVAELIYNLAVRLKNKIMYTYVGQTVIAVNPFQMIEGLYTEENIQHYYDKFIHD